MTGVRTKVYRVHLAGGVAIDVLAPAGSVVDLQSILSWAIELATRYLALAYVPLVTKVNAAQTLPGDVQYVVTPAPGQKILKSGLARRPRT